MGYPACTLETEWGGVAPEWWSQAIHQYQWDVQVVDILEEEPYTWYVNRYNVVLQKNKLGEAKNQRQERPVSDEEEEEEDVWDDDLPIMEDFSAFAALIPPFPFDDDDELWNESTDQDPEDVVISHEDQDQPDSSEDEL